MKELLKEVELSVKSELERANRVHPLFNLPHEAIQVAAMAQKAIDSMQ